jgi:hypothetical protein
VEEFVSCGVWPLAVGVDFEQVKVGEMLVSKLKVSLPIFPLCREDGEDDVQFLVRVDQEARVTVGRYTCTKHEACVAGLRNNGRLNRVFELTGVPYGPRPAPVSAEVFKKRKVDAAEKVLAKCLKEPEKRKGATAKVAAVPKKRIVEIVKITVAPEKRKTEPTKVTVTQVKGGFKWSSDKDIASAKSTKPSKNIVPRVIASVAVTCITLETRGSNNVSGALSYPGLRKSDRSLYTCAQDVQFTRIVTI